MLNYQRVGWPCQSQQLWRKNLVREFAAFSVYSRGELSGDGPLTLAIDGDTAIFGSRTSLTLGLVNIFGRNLQHDRTCLCHQSENRWIRPNFNDLTWLVVSNIFLFFHHIWDSPFHWLIFFKMVKTTNQQWFNGHWSFFCLSLPWGAATWSQRFNWATDCWIQRRLISGIAAVGVRKWANYGRWPTKSKKWWGFLQQNVGTMSTSLKFWAFPAVKGFLSKVSGCQVGLPRRWGGWSYSRSTTWSLSVQGGGKWRWKGVQWCRGTFQVNLKSCPFSDFELHSVQNVKTR